MSAIRASSALRHGWRPDGGPQPDALGVTLRDMPCPRRAPPCRGLPACLSRRAAQAVAQSRGPGSACARLPGTACTAPALVEQAVHLQDAEQGCAEAHSDLLSMHTRRVRQDGKVNVVLGARTKRVLPRQSSRHVQGVLEPQRACRRGGLDCQGHQGAPASPPFSPFNKEEHCAADRPLLASAEHVWISMQAAHLMYQPGTLC